MAATEDTAALDPARPAPSAPNQALGVLDIETRSIDWIPPAERHGSPWRVSPLFFIGNWSFFTVAIGFTGPALGLTVWWSIASATLGLAFGTFFMAFHATQGPRLGLPQIIQSRAQFGFRGAIIAVIVALACYVAFGVIDTVLLDQGLAGVFGWSPTLIGVVVNVVAALIAISGHDQLHRVSRATFALTLPFFVVFSAAILFGHAGGHAPDQHAHFILSAFLTQFSVAAAYNIAFAPVVSDYTRYLPANTRSSSLIASVYAGAGISALWLIAIGAWLSAHYGATDALVALRDSGDHLLGGFGSVIAVLSAVTLVVGLGVGAYSVMLQLLTGLDSFKKVRPTRRFRVTVIIVAVAVWTVVALPFGNDVISIVSNSLSLMLYLLVPWTAVNLVDFFFVRRGHYAITDLFTPRGIYRAWGTAGMLSYLLGFLAMLPFAVLPFYTGPIASVINKLDISYVPGLLVASVAYLLLTRRRDQAAETAAIAHSDDRLAALISAGAELEHQPPMEHGLLEP
jgi:nucleobase:cation symporter-1, NCS1 family